MRTVVQRVTSASVVVEGRAVAEIGRGLLALVGLEAGDDDATLAWTAEKLAFLRVFEDGAGKMNLAAGEIGGSILLVPNFTVAGSAAKGRRPSFDGAMKPDQARPMFERLVEAVRAHGVPVQAGVFGADMAVTLVNDGPVTLILDSRAST
ncbi:MAG: D-aminoacyl-tRNA deacylase [Phycisphaerae bacterium]|nr:MAG: D-aminoacyl-tRNA deacylase [Phycisphaerae bacterium]